MKGARVNPTTRTGRASDSDGNIGPFSETVNAFKSYIYHLARPRSLTTAIKVTITDSPKLGLYLDELMAEEGYGHSRGEVAKTLVWRAIEDLITRSLLDRRRATAADRRGVTAARDSGR